MKSPKSKNENDFYKLFKPQLTPKKNDGIRCFWWLVFWAQY